MMPILNLQQRSRELGRIRIGQQVATGTKGKTRPEKLDRFRLTSASRPLLENVAALYGGEVVPWNGAGSEQFEVITTATRLPVLVPPQPVSQYYETWSGGGCTRRCDGERELLSDKPCLCSPDPEERECKPTTRLNVVLKDVAGVGVWRLESHGYYAATELPSTAEFLAQTGGYIHGWLSLEERIIKRTGQPTRKFMVPTIEVDVTPAALMAGGGTAGALTTGTQPAAALEAAPPTPLADVVTVAQIEAAPTLQELRRLYDHARSINQPADEAVTKAFAARAAALEQAGQTSTQPAPSTPDEPEPERPITPDQLTKLHTVLTEIGVTDRAEKLTAISLIVHQPISSSKDLTLNQACTVIDELEKLAQSEDPAMALGVYLGYLADEQRDGEGQ